MKILGYELKSLDDLGYTKWERQKLNDFWTMRYFNPKLECPSCHAIEAGYLHGTPTRMCAACDFIFEGPRLVFSDPIQPIECPECHAISSYISGWGRDRRCTEESCRHEWIGPEVLPYGGK